MNKEPSNNVPKTIEGFTDKRWVKNTIYNHYNHPKEFMNSVLQQYDNSSDYVKKLIDNGQQLYEKLTYNTEYKTLYKDVADKVKQKLITRGFTTAMLYSTVEFTSENTGVMSKQRAMLGKRDCFFKNPTISNGKLFHDIYINLSYQWSYSNEDIRKKSYALFALTRTLSKVIPIRVIVVNHVGTTIPTCYSYILKQFGVPINPENFLFFTSGSKRTFGWAYNHLLTNDDTSITVGYPENTVSIATFNLDKEIDNIFLKIKQHSPGLFKMV